MTREEWINQVRMHNGLPPIMFDDLSYQETIDIDYEDVTEDESKTKGKVWETDQQRGVQRQEVRDQGEEEA